MRKVTCKDCGRVYDYDKDDFCPKCGSYNAPAGGRATQLEQELLSRFEDNRARGSTTAAAAPPKAPPRGPEETARPRPAAKPTGGGRSLLQGYRCQNAPALGAGAQRRGSAALVSIVLGLVMLTAVIAWAAMDDASPSGSGGAYAVGESFTIGKLDITVDDVRYLDQPEGSRLQVDGSRILLVDVYITGGSASSGVQTGDVYLTVDGGGTSALENDPVFFSRLGDLGVYAITPEDARWEDPLVGELVFYVPNGAETATLYLTDAKQKAVWTVALDLSQ